MTRPKELVEITLKCKVSRQHAKGMKKILEGKNGVLFCFFGKEKDNWADGSESGKVYDMELKFSDDKIQPTWDIIEDWG